ncbi:MAG TPA: TIM barrel protein, partial [Thermomicrobiales bacterium]|nr:TIM barrel protein [Thermomicrobiales bacterium]
MVRFCANISMLFAEAPFLDRFELAKAAGFEAVEFQFPYEIPAAEIQIRLLATGQELVLFNFPAGNFAAGDRGMATDPDRVDQFQALSEQGLEYASILRPAKMNCLAGKLLEGVSHEAQRETLLNNLAWLADRTAEAGIRLVIEPLNPFDAPDFFLPTPSSGFNVVADLNHPNLKVEYDIYHAQRTEGNIVETIAANFAHIGHIQLADAPDRNEPGTG